MRVPDSSNPLPSTMPHAADAEDRALMNQIASGDRQAFSRFYDRFSSTVFAWCLRALRDRPEAEDLLVDIFAEMWERARHYDASLSAPFTYLMNLARLRLIDRLRRLGAQRRRPQTPLENHEPAGLLEPLVPASGPLGNAMLAEQRTRLLQAMGQLTGDQRKAVELAYFDALSQSEIAKQLGTPLGTVKSRIRQALAKLRELLSGENA